MWACVLILTYIYFFNTVPKATKSNYPNNPLWSTETGEPLKNLDSYYHINTKYKDGGRVIPFDTTHLAGYAASLFVAKEPVLSNYYLGREIFRLVLFHDMAPPLIITLTKDNLHVILHCIQLSYSPTHEAIIYGKLKPFPIPIPNAWIEEKVKNHISSDSLDRRAHDFYFPPTKIINDFTINLTLIDWGNFVQLLKASNYWDLIPNEQMDPGEFGANTVYLESHMKDKYWIVNRMGRWRGLEGALMYLHKVSGIKYE